MIINGTTSTGFKYAIDERAKTDWRLVRLIATLKSTSATDEDQALALCNVLDCLFDDNGADLEKHVASLNDGYIPSDAMFNEVGEILSGDSDLKK